MTDGIRVDPHVKVLDDTVVERAKARGLDAIVYAPHFTRLPDIEVTAERFTDEELLVIPGREVFTGTWRNRKHVLALDLDEPVPDFIDLDDAFRALTDQNAVVLVPHPTFLTVSLTAADIGRYRESIHAVETYNPKHWSWHNRAARSISRTTELPTFASSYAHLRGSIGEVWTTFPHVERSRDAIVDAFRSGATRTVERRSGLGHQLRCTAEFAHLFYENSWAKFDRVVLSGTEATHPSQPAYDGRFTVADGL